MKLIDEIHIEQMCGLETMQEDLLADMIHATLKNKNYFLVCDFICSVDAWNIIRPALPDNNNSRVLVTTRKADLAAYCSRPSTNVYNLA